MSKVKDDRKRTATGEIKRTAGLSFDVTNGSSFAVESFFFGRSFFGTLYFSKQDKIKVSFLQATIALK